MLLEILSRLAEHNLELRAYKSDFGEMCVELTKGELTARRHITPLRYVNDKICGLEINGLIDYFLNQQEEILGKENE